MCSPRGGASVLPFYWSNSDLTCSFLTCSMSPASAPVTVAAFDHESASEDPVQEYMVVHDVYSLWHGPGPMLTSPPPVSLAHPVIQSRVFEQHYEIPRVPRLRLTPELSPYTTTYFVVPDTLTPVPLPVDPHILCLLARHLWHRAHSRSPPRTVVIDPGGSFTFQTTSYDTCALPRTLTSWIRLNAIEKGERGKSGTVSLGRLWPCL